MAATDRLALQRELPGRLRSLVTDAMMLATKQGLPVADATEITLFAAVDFARSVHGDSYLQDLAQKVIDRAGCVAEALSKNPR